MHNHKVDLIKDKSTKVLLGLLFPDSETKNDLFSGTNSRLSKILAEYLLSQRFLMHLKLSRFIILKSAKILENSETSFNWLTLKHEKCHLNHREISTEGTFGNVC